MEKLKLFIGKFRINLLWSLLLTFLLVLLNWYVTGYTLFSSLLSDDFYTVLPLVLIGTLIIQPFWQKIYFGYFLFLFLIEMLHWRYFGSPIIPGEIYKFFTDFTEVTQGIGKEILLRFVLPAFFTIGIGISMHFIFKKYAIQMAKLPFIGFAPLIVIIVLAYNFSQATTFTIAFRTEQHLIRSGLELNAAFFGKYLPYKLSDKAKSAIPAKPLPKEIVDCNSNIILVVGESATCVRMSVFDYTVNTTPFLSALKKENKLFAKKCVPQATCTDVSLLSFFNLLDSIDQYETVLAGKQLLFKLAKDHGYKTYFITTQSAKGSTHYLGQMNKNFIDVVKTSKDIDPSKGDNDNCYDEVLLKELEGIDLESGKNFVVLQMYGSHENYSERYPSAFSRFDKSKYPFPQNADYDNTLLYTDHVLNGMIQHLQNKSKAPAYFFYMSDHGECQGEEGEDVFGHLMFRKNVASTPLLMMPIRTQNDSAMKRIMNYPYLFSNYFLSLEIARLLGYDFRYKARGNYLMNGVDLCGMDGYAWVIVNDSCVLDIR